MKLTAEQIEYVSNYVQSFDIKWYELQVELTDHLVSIMEEIWEEDKELTFHQVKYRAEQRFGRNYFKEVEEERKTILRKEYKNQQWRMVGEYLKFPKIIMSFLLVVLVYRLSFYFEDISSYIKILLGVLLGASIVLMFNGFRFRKIKGERFLLVEMVITNQNSSLCFTYGIIGLDLQFKDFFQENHLFFLPFCCVWALGVLLIITGNHLTNKIVLDIKKQYQLT
jgi:hypothetical protein